MNNAFPSPGRTTFFCRPLGRTLSRYAVAVSIALLAGCGGGGGEETQAPVQEPAPVYAATVTLTGRVLSAGNGLPVANAQVTAAGTTAATDASGNYTLANVGANEKVTVTFAAAGFAPTTQVAVRGTLQSLNVNATLLPVAASQQIDPANGGTVTVAGSPAQVQLPAGGLVRTDGAPISGSVTVEVTPIPVAANTGWMPGDFTAITNNQVATIESFGAMTVTLKDAQGARVNLAAGRTSTIRIPVSSRSATVPATIPLFWFDESTGRWVEEGTATLMGTAPDQYYEGTVSHFTTWNADQYQQTIQVTGCLVDENGARIANGVIASDGIDYSGTSSVRTDSSGNFSLPIRMSSRAILMGLLDTRITSTREVGPSASNIDLGTSCLSLSGTTAGINVKLTWGAGPEDLDSHLITPDGQQIYYSNEGSLINAPFANLDVDDVDSYGPEVVTITRLQVGTYHYYVNNYSETFVPGMIGSPTRVELNVNNNSSLYVPPAGEDNNLWWHVFDLTVDAECNTTVTPVNAWTAEPVVTPGTATYCSRPN